MSRVCVPTIDDANIGPDVRVGKSADLGGVFDALRKKFRARWSLKTAHQVAARTHISVRSAERFLTQDGELSAEAIIHLLRSDEGLRVLVILMDRARPAWWAGLLKLGLLGGIERRREADLRLVRSIMDANEATALPAAVSFQDAEFFAPFIEALAAASGPQNAPMAGPMDHGTAKRGR